MKTACPPLVLPRSLRPALRTNTVPDFLVPRLWAISSKRHGTSNRTILTASSERKNDVNTVKPVLELSKAQRHYLDSAVCDLRKNFWSPFFILIESIAESESRWRVGSYSNIRCANASLDSSASEITVSAQKNV